MNEMKMNAKDFIFGILAGVLYFSGFFASVAADLSNIFSQNLETAVCMFIIPVAAAVCAALMFRHKRLKYAVLKFLVFLAAAFLTYLIFPFYGMAEAVYANFHPEDVREYGGIWAGGWFGIYVIFRYYTRIGAAVFSAYFITKLIKNAASKRKGTENE